MCAPDKPQGEVGGKGQPHTDTSRTQRCALAEVSRTALSGRVGGGEERRGEGIEIIHPGEECYMPMFITLWRDTCYISLLKPSQMGEITLADTTHPYSAMTSS